MDTKEFVVPCLESIQANGPEALYEVVLVDNGSTDGTDDVVRQRFPSVRMIRNEANVGFTMANNQGLRACQGKYALLLNDDTVVLPGALAEMVNFMRQHPLAGIVGCKHIGPDGETQPAAGSLPGFWAQFASFYGLRRLLPKDVAGWLVRSPIGAAMLRRLAAGYFIPYEAGQKARKVGFVSGACLLARRELWEEIGLLDERIFIYLEDADWCRRAAAAGWELYYLPSARIVHHQGQSSMKRSGGRTYHMSSNRIQSLMYYCRKHNGMTGLIAAKAIVVPAIVGRLGLTTLRMLRPKADRRLLASEAAHLRSVLRVGLRA
jgi:GT2 family glycosyltransferase